MLNNNFHHHYFFAVQKVAQKMNKQISSIIWISRKEASGGGGVRTGPTPSPPHFIFIVSENVVNITVRISLSEEESGRGGGSTRLEILPPENIHHNGDKR